MHTYAHTYVLITYRAHMYIHTYIHAHILLHIYIYTYTHTHTLSTRTHVFIMAVISTAYLAAYVLILCFSSSLSGRRNASRSESIMLFHGLAVSMAARRGYISPAPKIYACVCSRVYACVDTTCTHINA
jgi:hypothetical protein